MKEPLHHYKQPSLHDKLGKDANQREEPTIDVLAPPTSPSSAPNAHDSELARDVMTAAYRRLGEFRGQTAGELAA